MENQETINMEKKKAKFEMTISKELFAGWKKNRRRGDTEKLMEITGKSRPVIDRALNFGHAKKDELIDAISTFFINRMQEEKQLAKEMK